jgi:hypothetical protein
MSVLSKILTIKSIKPNGYTYHADNAIMCSDKTKSAPHQVILIKYKLIVTFMPALSGLFFAR